MEEVLFSSILITTSMLMVNFMGLEFTVLNIPDFRFQFIKHFYWRPERRLQNFTEVPANYSHPDIFIDMPINGSYPGLNNYTYFDMYGSPDDTKDINIVYKNPLYHFIQAYNCYVNFYGSLIFRDGKFFHGDLYKDRRQINPYRVIRHYPHILCIGYGECDHNFGHALEDIAQPLLFFLHYYPKELQKNAYFLYNGFPPVMDVIIDLLNIPKSRVIVVDKHSWLSCDIISSIVNPVSFINAFGIHTKRLQMFLHEKFGLSRIKPTRYVFMNRAYKRPRHILNLPEIFKQTKLTYPEYNWENQTDIYSLRQAAPVFASIKFMFTPTGSNCVKAYVMHSFSCIVIATCHCGDRSIAAVISNCDIFCLMYKGIPGFHHDNGGKEVNMNEALKQIGRGLQTLKDHKIPL